MTRTEAGESTSSTEKPVTPACSTAPSGRGPLYLVLAVALIWWTWLGWTAYQMANPVTLNPVQLRSAQLLVLGTVTDISGGRVEVDEFYPESAELVSPIAIDSLDELPVREGSRYWFPLTASSAGRFKVTQARLPGPEGEPQRLTARYVYPDTQQTRQLLKDLWQSASSP